MKSTSHLPKAIFYDWDGTLADSLAFIARIHNQVRVEFGLQPFTPEEAEVKLVRAAAEVFPEIYGDRWKEAYDRLYVLYDQQHLQSLSKKPATEEVLKTAQSKGLLQGICSNKRGLYLRPEVTYSALDAYFDGCVYGAGDVANAKPAPDMLLLAAEHHGVAPTECWYVGDTASDMHAAVAAKMRGVYIGQHNAEAMGLAHISLKTLKEFAAILNGKPE